MLEEWIQVRDQIEASKSDLAGQDLSYKKLMQAKLDQANLKGADLSYSYLIRANLSQADLSEADLTSAVLSEANLSGANLEGTELEDAYLHGADLSEVKNLTCDQLEFAQIDKDTQLPDYLQIKWISDTSFECKE